MEHGKKIDFRTIDDARTYYINSGMLEWAWFHGFSEDDLISYLYEHAQDDVSIDYFIAEFLVSKGQDPRDYALYPPPVCFLCANYGLITEATDEVEVMELMQPVCPSCLKEMSGN